MGLRGLLTGENVRYRVRIFDHGKWIKTAYVPNKGQAHFPITVHAKMLGFGEKTRLEFMLNPKLQPKDFGEIFEVDFDIRDSAQLGDLLDIMPDLVYEINQNYKNAADSEHPTIDAEINKIDDQLLEEDPKPEETSAEEEDEKTGAEKVAAAAKAAAEVASIAIPNLPIVSRFRDDITRDRAGEILKKCQKYPKLLYWVPDRLNIEPEVHALVSQSRIVRCGIMPSYYKKQSDAEIAEKVLAKPAQPKGWQDVAIIGLIIICIIVVLLIATGHI
jgi:hypothetical protein